MILRQFLRFGIVGALATLVHIVIGATLIHSGWPALWANAMSFLIAFMISFMGHFGFSFVDLAGDLLTSLKRFSAVAVCGFAFNETLLALLLRLSDVSPIAALTLTTALTAIGTFIFSRNWAFRPPSSVIGKETEGVK